VKGRKKAGEQKYKCCKLCPNDRLGVLVEKTGNMGNKMREKLHQKYLFRIRS